MQIFSPWSLLWLVPLVPIIVFFYLLKLKRKEMVVSSVLLWSHLVKDVQANAPFQKLKRNLLLFLQLLIVTLAVLALARPAFMSQSRGGSNVVVVLDGSASMQSRDAGTRTRFDAARDEALKMVADMRGGDRMLVLLATSRTKRLSAFTTDKGELRRALDGAKPADTTTNLRDAVLLAASVAGQQPGGRIYVFSDGAFAPMEEIDTRGSELRFEKVGTRSENVGLVAMDVRRTFKDESSYQMFVAIRNYSPEPKKTNLEFYRGDALIDVRPVELPAADKTTGYAEKAEVLVNLPASTGILRARLDLKDDLEADNEAYAQLSARQKIRVLLVTDGDLYLEKALNLDPQVEVSTTAPANYTGQAGFDVVVFENTGPKSVGPGAHLYINCGGPSAPVDIRGKIKEASILSWERSHPVMRYVKLSSLNMQEALLADKKPWGVTLAEHSDGPVIAVGEKAGVKSAYVGFPLMKTDFPLRVAFPIFVNNMVQWLAAGPGRTEGVQLRAGETAPIEVPPGVSEVTVTSPNGRKSKVQPDGRLAYFSDTEERGVYSVTGPNRYRRDFAVNLLSRDESATAPQQRIQFGRRPVEAGAGTTKTSSEVWRWLALLALLVLGVEWWVYHRRI